MFRFDIVKPQIQEVIHQKEVSKESLRQVFFYNLLELQRLREHLHNLDSKIEQEGDLYALLRLGDRKMYTGESIMKRKTITMEILPLLVKICLKEYLEDKNIDRWDYLVLYRRRKIENFLSGNIGYLRLLES